MIKMDMPYFNSLVKHIVKIDKEKNVQTGSNIFLQQQIQTKSNYHGKTFSFCFITVLSDKI